MRGYFGIGVEGINKPFNVGNLFRSANAFDASFVFTVAATYTAVYPRPSPGGWHRASGGSIWFATPALSVSGTSAYGEDGARTILGTVRHNTVYYPSLTIKGAIQSIRVARPLAADRTLIESWTFRLKGAPESLLQRTVMYNRLINSPFSVVGTSPSSTVPYRRTRRPSGPRSTKKGCSTTVRPHAPAGLRSA